MHLVKPETTICTQHTLGINALLVLLVSFIYGCLARESHGRLYVYLGPRLQEAVEFDSDRRCSLTRQKYYSVLTQETLLNRVEGVALYILSGTNGHYGVGHGWIGRTKKLRREILPL
jgi:hypothetical protein